VDGKKIVVLGTGGTIAGTAPSAYDNTGYRSAQRGVGELLQALPAPLPFCVDIVAEQVAQIDSKDMGWAEWRLLQQRCQHWLAQPEVQGLVITHGTDTLEETAYFLHAVLDAHKPVVLTCAMRPASSINADGPQNLWDALLLAVHPQVHGVLVVCAGAIHGALDVQKVHPTRLDAFDSGEAGVLGVVEGGQVRQLRPWPQGADAETSRAMAACLAWPDWPRVELLWSHAGACGATVDALVSPEVAQRLGAPRVQGLVVAATGNGSLHHALEEALLRAQAGGVRVLRATRCWEGRVMPLVGQAVEDARGLSAVKARVALMLELLAEQGRNAA
jgi:L-asparaginase